MKLFRVQLGLSLAAVFFVPMARCEEPKVAELIQTIGDSDRYEEREQATDRLIALGMPALPAVRAAAADSNLERAERARRIEQTVLDNLAWTPRKVERHIEDRPLSELLSELAYNERSVFVWGDWTGRLSTPEDPKRSWDLRGSPWDSIETLCEDANVYLLPIGRAGNVALCCVERPSAPAPKVEILDGIRFTCDEAPQRGEDPERLVLNFRVFGDNERTLGALSREAFVLRAVTDSGEELERIGGFELGLEEVRFPWLNCHETYARVSVPKRPCKRIAKLELEIEVLAFGFPQHVVLTNDAYTHFVRSEDGTRWKMRGYRSDASKAGCLSVGAVKEFGVPNAVGSVRLFVDNQTQWFEATTIRTERDDDGDCVVYGDFVAPALAWPQQIEVRYFTRAMFRRFSVSFENISLSE